MRNELTLNPTLQELHEHFVSDNLRQLHEFQQGKKRSAQGDGSPLRTGFLGLSPREVRDYSLCRALHTKFLEEGKHSSLETECHDRLTRVFQHKHFERSLLVPADILYRGMDTSPGAKGGYAVGTQIGGFIDTLRSISLLKRLGAQGLSGAQGNLLFPRRKSGAAVQWLIPGVSAADNPPVFGLSSSTPKTAVTFTEMSEQLLRQMSPEGEAFIMATFGRDMAAELDRVGLVGPGGAQILGILNAPIDVSVSGTSLGYSGVCDLMEVVSNANGAQNLDALGFIASPAIAKLLKSRQRFTNVDSPLWRGGLAAGSIEDVPAYSTTSMASGKLLYGDFSNVLIIDWGVLELDIDRSGERFNQGLVGIRAMWMVDILVLHPESFAVIANIT
jgi:HK97 family phage major capsid protein